MRGGGTRHYTVSPTGYLTKESDYDIVGLTGLYAHQMWALPVLSRLNPNHRQDCQVNEHPAQEVYRYSCADCGYTDLYKGDTSQLADALDFLAG